MKKFQIVSFFEKLRNFGCVLAVFAFGLGAIVLGVYIAIPAFPVSVDSFSDLFFAGLALTVGLLIVGIFIISFSPLNSIDFLPEQTAVVVLSLGALFLWFLSLYQAINAPAHIWGNIAGGKYYMSPGLVLIGVPIFLFILLRAYFITLKIWSGKSFRRQSKSEIESLADEAVEGKSKKTFFERHEVLAVVRDYSVFISLGLLVFSALADNVAKHLFVPIGMNLFLFLFALYIQFFRERKEERSFKGIAPLLLYMNIFSFIFQATIGLYIRGDQVLASFWALSFHELMPVVALYLLMISVTGFLSWKWRKKKN